VRDKAFFVQGSRNPGESADPHGQRLPSNDDIWQAASLLIGVYGRDAADYAAQRRNRLGNGEDGSGAMIWQLILSRIQALLGEAPAQPVN